MRILDIATRICYSYMSTTSSDENRNAKDLDRLSKLGHFLKGSSSSVGLASVSKLCALMQNYGSEKDDTGLQSISKEDALDKLEKLLPDLKAEQGRAKKWLETFYKEEW